MFTGARTADGYGQVQSGGQTVGTHRVAWQHFNGPIPDGFCVLHTCDNPPCCNPAHLFLGTQLDNAQDRDAKGRGAWSLGATCRRGHPWTPENTQVLVDGRRRCRTCRLDAARRWKAARRG